MNCGVVGAMTRVRHRSNASLWIGVVSGGFLAHITVLGGLFPRGDNISAD